MLNKFLTKFLPKAVAPSRRGRAARHNSPGRRLRMECLENRLTLSGSPVLVTSSADSGAGSLRAAIGSAVPGETIRFASNIHSITLKSGDLPISTNLTIEGPGADKLTISGNNNSRIFDVASGATVTITGLTITDGMVNTITNSNMTTWGGGGILNELGATLTLVNDTLSNNQAVNNQAISVLDQDEFGGGLFNMGHATVSACTFANNQVLGGGSDDAIGGSAGGAIDNYGGATLTVANTLFSNNRVVSAGGAFYFAMGGAIENNAGVDGSTPSTAILTDCTFLGNLAQAGPQAISNGGAILSEGTGTSMTLTGCLISGNRSVGGEGGNFNEALGGGVMNTGNMIIADCTITDNQVVGGNNGMYSATWWVAGDAFGGGIANIGSGTVLDIANSTVSSNTSQGGANAPGPGSSGFGGGIDCDSGSTLTVTDSQISNNSAIGGPGGAGTAIGTPGAAGFGCGGGIGMSGNSTAMLVGCTISGNVAQGSAGNNGGDGLGGGVGFYGPLSGATDNSVLTAISCSIVGNQALGGQGANGGDGLGGGLAILNGTSATLRDTLVENNDALGGAAGYCHGGSNGNGVGGGVYVFSGGTFSSDVTTDIKHNFASTSNDNIFNANP